MKKKNLFMASACLLLMICFTGCPQLDTILGTLASAPAAPTVENSATDISANWIKIKWNAVPDATGYDVYVYHEKYSGNAIKNNGNGTVTDTTYKVTGLEADTPYYIWLKSKNETGDSGFSTPLEIKTATAPIAIPKIPTQPRKEAVSTVTIDLNWDRVDDATSYLVYVGRILGDTPAATVEPIEVTGNTYTVRNLTIDTTYYIWLKSKNAKGSSDYSSKLTVKTASEAPNELKAPPKPQVKNIATNSMDIYQYAVDGATAYDVHIGTTNNPANAELTFTDIKEATYEAKNLTAGTTYYVWVKAKNESIESNFSEMQTVKTALAVPTNLKATSVTKDSISIIWESVLGATGYDIYMGEIGTIPSASTKKGSVTNETNEYKITGLEANKDYNIWLKATNAEGSSDYSSVLTVATTTSVGVPPSVPEEPYSFNITSTSILIFWEPVLSATGYDVYLGTKGLAATSAKKHGSATDTFMDQPSYTIENLSAATEYNIWVKAKNADGSSDFSPVLTETTAPEGKPLAPEYSAGSYNITTTSISIVCPPALGATGYDVYLGAKGTASTSATRKGSATDTFMGYPSYTIKDLTVNTEYNIWLKATNSDGSSDFSPVLTVSTAPEGPPSALEQLYPGSITSTSITIGWNEALGATGYDVYLGNMGSNSTSATKHGSTADSYSGYEITGLKAGTTYNIWVKATNADGVSDYSPVLTVKTVPEGPPPALNQLYYRSVTATSIDVSWDSAFGATGYDVYIGAEKSTAASATKKGSAIRTSYEITGLEAGTTYNIWVKAKNADGMSEFSPVLTVKTAPEGKPSAPTNLSSNSITTTSIQINWPSALGATGYDVYTGTTANSADAIVNGSTRNDSTWYELKELKAGTTYYIWVKATNADGMSDYSPVLTVTTAPEEAPPAPKELWGGSGTKTSIHVNWSSALGATGYDVYLGTTPNSATATKKSSSSNWYEITGLKAGTTYYIWVKATNTYGESDFSEMLTVTTAPEEPVLLSAGSITATSIDIYWPAVNGATGYNVYKGTTIDSTEVSYVGYSASSNYSITDLTENTTYYIWVKATNTDGSSDFSPVLTVKTLPVPTATPAAPVDLSSYNITTNDMTIRWNSVVGATEYDVYLGTTTNSADAKKNNTYTHNYTNYNVSDLTPNTTYYIWVRAKNNIGDSVFSTMLTVKTLPIPTAVPVAPIVPVVKDMSENSIDIHWVEVADATYDVYVGTTTNSADATKKTTYPINSTRYNISGLTANTTYYIWIKAKNTFGDSEFSPMLTAKTLPVPTAVPVAPVNLNSYRITTTGMSIEWDDVVGATEYDVYLGTTPNSADAKKNNTYTFDYSNYSVSGLTANTTYYIWLKAKNTFGYSVFSTMLTVKTLPTPTVIPAVPQNLRVGDVSSDFMHFYWNEVTGAESYGIYYNTSGIPPTQDTTPKTTTYGNNIGFGEFTPNTTYYIWIRASNEKGSSAYSSVVTAKTDPETAPGAPATPTVVASYATSITVSWDEVPRADGYDVYCSTSSTAPTATTTPTTSVNYFTSCNITGLSANTTYYIWVRAKNSFGESSYSTMLTAPTESVNSTPVRDRVGAYYAEIEPAFSVVFMLKNDGQLTLYTPLGTGTKKLTTTEMNSYDDTLTFTLDTEGSFITATITLGTTLVCSFDGISVTLDKAGSLTTKQLKQRAGTYSMSYSFPGQQAVKMSFILEQTGKITLRQDGETSEWSATVDTSVLNSNDTIFSTNMTMGTYIETFETVFLSDTQLCLNLNGALFILAKE